MKKLFSLAVALIAMSATVFTSCSKDKDDDVDPSAFDKAVVQLNLDFSQDLVDYFDITVGVTDFDGKSNSLPVTKAMETTDNFVTTSKNGKCTITYDCKLKSGVKLDNQEVEFKAMCDIREVILNKSNQEKEGTVELFPYKDRCFIYHGPLNEAVVKLYEISTSHVSVLENGAFK